MDTSGFYIDRKFDGDGCLAGCPAGSNSLYDIIDGFNVMFLYLIDISMADGGSPAFDSAGWVTG